MAAAPSGWGSNAWGEQAWEDNGLVINYGAWGHSLKVLAMERGD